MPKIIICQGTRSSGKTDWTKQWVLKDPEHRVRYSIEYKDSIVPLQESTDEDATTATYKKTYKFIGTW